MKEMFKWGGCFQKVYFDQETECIHTYEIFIKYVK